MSANANGEVNLAFSSGSVYSLDRESETPKISFPNGEYDDSDQNPYSYIPEQSRNNNTTASQQNEPNDGYEMPIEVLQHHRRLATQERERKVRRRRPKRLLDSWFNRVVICLIVLFSAVAIFLVLLLMLGKVGPKCTSCDSGVPPPEVSKQISPDEPEAVMNLSPLKEIAETLKEEYLAALKYAKLNRDQLEGIKKEQNTTQSDLNGFKRNLNDMILKLNDTAQQMNPEHGPVFSALSNLNSTFAEKVQESASQLEKAAEGLRDEMNQMNATLSTQLQAKLQEPGPDGPQGRNGSQGPQGPEGAQGDKGPQAHNGTQGSQGPQGPVGDRGPDGANGTQGLPGAKGSVGVKGAKGEIGDKGSLGDQGQTGIGNFSWCEQLKKESANSVTVTETNGYRVFWVQCATAFSTPSHDYASQLERTTSNGFDQYNCVCKTTNSTHPPPCTLRYWKCPVMAP